MTQQKRGSNTAELAGITGSYNFVMKIDELNNPKLRRRDIYLNIYVHFYLHKHCKTSILSQSK